MNELEILCRRSAKRARRKKRRRKTTLVIILAAAALVCLYALVMGRIRPAVTEFASAELSGKFAALAAETVEEAVAVTGSDYTDMVYLEMDGNGRVTALRINAPLLTSVNAEIVRNLSERLRQPENISLELPLGSILGAGIITGGGPTVKFRVSSAQVLKPSIESRFEETGINQTLHTIMYTGQINCSVLFCGVSVSCPVKYQAAAAQTVIVGEVPESYTYFRGVEDTQDAINRYYDYQ